MRQKHGFSLIEGLIVLGVVVLLAGVGYVGWKAFTGQNGSSSSPAAIESETVEVITTKADLEAAEKALDELNFEDTEAAEAEAQANL